MVQVVQGGNAFVYQIFYNEETKSQLDPGFIPVDNTNSPKSDWYEFWVIMNYLKNNVLRDDAWYGFLSPRFFSKTAVDANTLFAILSYAPDAANVVLFQPDWDQIALYRNPFEQGDRFHPGLGELSQIFFNGIGLGVNVSEMVTHAYNSVFSNYIIAKPVFWRKWLTIAEKFFHFVEGDSGADYRKNLDYRKNFAPMKVFIQERIATVVLTQNVFGVMAPDTYSYTQCLKEDPQSHKLLQCCEMMKQRYCNTGDQSYLDMYYKIRAEMGVGKP